MPAGVVVGGLAGAGLGLWLLDTAAGEGLPAAGTHLLAALIALGLLAVLASLVHQTRRLARQLTHDTDTDTDTDTDSGC